MSEREQIERLGWRFELRNKGQAYYFWKVGEENTRFKAFTLEGVLAGIRSMTPTIQAES